MKFNISIHKVLALLLVVGIFASLTFTSCRRSRYKRMIKKRRGGTMKKARHRGAYQKKLRKETLSVESPYFIKRKKNYKRRPWYN